MSGILRRLGKKHIELATIWMGSGLAYGAAAGMAITYVTDWKLVLQYLPYYNGMFKDED